MTSVAIADLAALIAVMVGFGGLVFGLRQYYIGQKWKKSEFAAAILEQLVADERLATCCKMLDWSARRFPVPEQYRVLFEQPTFTHTWAKVITAMKPEEEKGSFSWQEMLYRDLFDHFFSYLERVNHYISIRLITVNDVSSLEYWLKQLASPRFVDQPVFIDFLRAYDYTEVFDLMTRFNIDYRSKPS